MSPEALLVSPRESSTKVEGPESSVTLSPTKNTKYILVGETFLTLLVPQWFKTSQEVRVLVNPVFPEIVQFEANDTDIDAGSSAITNLRPILIKDIRDAARPQGVAPDVGAYEVK